MKNGFVYYGKLDKEFLKKFIDYFFTDEETFYIVQDIDLYEPNESLPPEITKKGQVFSDKGEIRWEEKNEKYSVVILSEYEVAAIPAEITPINGNWTIKKENLYLTSPDAPHVSPNFKKYPKQVGDDAPRLAVSIYYRDSIATFVSPRGFVAYGT